MSLIFYYSPRSTAVATHWVLEELAVPYVTRCFRARLR